MDANIGLARTSRQPALNSYQWSFFLCWTLLATCVFAFNYRATHGTGIVTMWCGGLVFIFLGLSGSRWESTSANEGGDASAEVAVLNQLLLKRIEELETANRELDAFCSAASHDLRSPLTVISGYCQLIQTMLQEKHLDTCGSYIDIILKSVRTMDSLITTLLHFSRLPTGELRNEDVDLGALAGELAAELQLYDTDRNAVFSIPPSLHTRGDAGLLRIVMQNLLSNAWKYSANKPYTYIEIGRTVQDNRDVFYVMDNGIGFDGSESDRIFDPFYRLPNARDIHGTGIGLATVKRIINRHGGVVGCNGEPGVGAFFYFSLPKKNQETSQSSHRAQQPADPPKTGWTMRSDAA